MIRKLIVILAMLAGIAAGAAAQNAIDRMMDNYSAVGESKFTSAVERDPRTRKVKKVVNVLELRYRGIDEFLKTFRGESGSGDFSEEYSDDGCTLVLTVRKASQNRIYMMRCYEPYIPGRRNTRYGRAKITVIVNYK